jgi:SAM-dependent methyltransferase
MSEAGATLGWNPSLNLGAYASVETDSNYASPAALESYRRLLLEKSEPAARFIEKAAFRGAKLNVLELCSGSSRLLYALDRRGILAHGVGVEVSPSRHKFAESWKSALGANRVQNFYSAVGDYKNVHRDIDVAVLIDGALSYLYPCDPTLPGRVLSNLSRCLVPGGKIVMEFDVLSQEQVNGMRRDGRIKTWNKGDEKDAFRYALYETEAMSWEHMVVQNTSVYVPRSAAAESVKRELYKYYGVDELSALLDEAGFSAAYFGSFAMEPFTSQSPALIALASKR